MENSLKNRLVKIIKATKASENTKNKFIKRVREGNLTREENPRSHLCVYFAAYDPDINEIFIGHHIKSGLWLFNGGHMEKGETPEEAVTREIKEEWGDKVTYGKIGKPELLTLTKIEHPEKQICQWHYDFWYFLPVKKTQFNPDKNLLAKEFYQIGWKSKKEACFLVKDPVTNQALRFLKVL